MPRQPALTETRINNIITCLKPAVTLLNELSVAFGAPFVQAISETSLSLITALEVKYPWEGFYGSNRESQNTKKNKDECIQLTENIHQVLFVIISLHIKSEIAGSLTPAILLHIGKFTEYSCSPRDFRDTLTVINAELSTRLIHLWKASRMERCSNTFSTTMKWRICSKPVGMGCRMLSKYLRYLEYVTLYKIPILNAN